MINVRRIDVILHSQVKVFSDSPLPSISAVVSVDGRPVRLQLCDTAGQVSKVAYVIDTVVFNDTGCVCEYMCVT